MIIEATTEIELTAEQPANFSDTYYLLFAHLFVTRSTVYKDMSTYCGRRF
jgi:hypothetical protein